MKKYYVKFGNMYLKEIYINKDLYKNMFLRDIEFSYNNTLALKINDDEIYYIKKILEYIFDMPGAINDYITLEEVKEDGE